MGRFFALLAAVVFVMVAHTAARAQDKPWHSTIRRAAASFDRARFTSPDHAVKVKTGGTLSGGKTDWGITGSVEYDFDVPRAAWYEVHTIGLGPGVEYIVDPGTSAASSGSAYFFGTSGVFGRLDDISGAPLDKVGNVWLEPGRHTLRLQRYLWTGFPRIEGIGISESQPILAQGFRPALPEKSAVYRKAQCPALSVEAGGFDKVRFLTVKFDDLDDRTQATRIIRIEPSARPRQYQVPLYCERGGEFKIHYAEGPQYVDAREVPDLSYEVIDTVRPPVVVGPPRRLLQEIDCTAAHPDYQGGTTSTRTSASGPYRESGDTGFTHWQRSPAAAQAVLPRFSWFAYRLNSIGRQKLHLLEVDYPDDALRTFTITVREGLKVENQPTYMYPVSVGLDTGGEFRISNTMQTMSLFFWARGEEARVLLQTAHDGRRAACSRIRLFAVNEDLPPTGAAKAGRSFASWYEEGVNFLSFYGVREHWRPGALEEATRRAMAALRFAGYTTFISTVSVYEFTLYPSRFNRYFSLLDQDVLRQTLLNAERQGLDVIAELHPRSDELAWPLSTVDPKTRLMVSKDGETNFFQKDGTTRNLPPLYNPLHPDVRQYLVGMIGELADRYKDSPAFLGVGIRLIGVTNPGLSNFHSLDWGYDDLTLSRFMQDTGTRVPGPLSSPGGSVTREIAQARYRWLQDHARERWIQWRCEKIGELYRSIVARMRQARPDLKLYANLFARGATDTLSGGGADSAAEWREGGIDASILGRIDGVVLINATHAFGRREATIDRTQPLRDELLDPRKLRSFLVDGGSAAFISNANYLEQTEAVLAPKELGFPAGSKHGWTTSPAYPAGRHFLERYAVPLAETDAHMLGDGGNGYALGQPELRDWVAEYRTLPETAFTPLKSARDPVAVWYLANDPARSYDSRGFWFYLVNRERYPTRVSVNLAGVSTLERPAKGTTLPVASGRLTVEVEPYALQVYRAREGGSISSVTVSVPDAERESVRAIADSIDNMAANPLRLVALSKEQRNTLERTAAELRAELEAGHLWRVRTVAESWPMQEIYRQLRVTPPRLRSE